MSLYDAYFRIITGLTVEEFKTCVQKVNESGMSAQDILKSYLGEREIDQKEIREIIIKFCFLEMLKDKERKNSDEGGN